MNILLRAASAATLVLSAAGASAAVTDTIQAPTGFFVPTDAQKYDSPYYRGFGEDWGWTHNPIGGVITSAALNISAFDVDFDGIPGSFVGERDEIFAMDDGVWVSLGYLAGSNDIWAFTNFVLGPSFFDDIAAGLKVRMEIDKLNEGWLVTLAKSSLTVNGGSLPPPTPGIPEPATWAMLIAGFGLVGGMARRRRPANSIA
ncbi:PEPxxWA-CTERM sorting domain-containing protein [Thermaurantiacus sp.]